MTIYSISQITAEATAAAVLHSNVNDCCPYPFDTDAGRHFRKVFEATCKEVDDAISGRAALGIAYALAQFGALPNPVPNPVPQPEYQALVTVSGWAA